MIDIKLLTKVNPAKNIDEVISTMSKYLANHKIVMMGEASHGTEEYYLIRRKISEELIKNHGFNFIAVEGDWPECYELNKFIKSDNNKQSGLEVLKSFKRWPTWMWSNSEILKLGENLKHINLSRNKEDKVGFYGLDVYSLFESIDVVISELEKIDPELALLARYRYSCFEKFKKDEKAYLRSLMEFPEGCLEGTIKMLVDLLKMRIKNIDEKDDEIGLNIIQNAKIIYNAENYYRTMTLADDTSWNVRDRHMLETLESIMSINKNFKGIVWAHNTHIGDYRYTSMLDEGEVNIGGLAREKWGENEVALLGFGTYKGTVIASSRWAGSIKVLPVPPGIIGSYEELFHNICGQLKTTVCSVIFSELTDRDPEKKIFSETKGQRAIGVVYHPTYEWGNYVPTVLSRRYDAFIFIDKTTALKPLITAEPEKKEIPHDYPYNA